MKIRNLCFLGTENHELMPLKCSKHPLNGKHQPNENAVVDVSG